MEKQYEESSVSVDRTAAMRNVQLKLAHQQARNEVSLRLEAAKADVANLEQLDVLCQVFGFPSPHDLIEGQVPSGSEARRGLEIWHRARLQNPDRCLNSIKGALLQMQHPSLRLTASTREA